MVEKIIYDTLASGTSNTQHGFFTHDEGDDGISTTNLSEKNKTRRDFTVREIIVQISADLDTTDYVKLTEDAALRVYIDGFGYVLELPLFMVLSSLKPEIHGANATIAADIVALTNMLSNGYVLKEPFIIPKNTTFNVYVEMGSAFGTTTDMTVALVGEEGA